MLKLVLESDFEGSSAAQPVFIKAKYVLVIWSIMRIDEYFF